MNYCEENNETCKFIQLNGVKLCCFENGNIYKVLENGDMKYCKGWIDNGYLRTKINNKDFKHHRIIAYCFLELDIENSKLYIDHKNHIKTDNRIENLRIVTSQQNQFNRDVKGYYWVKSQKKWRAAITLNRKHISLGYFETEEEAHNAYLEAKEKYHPIPENSTA